MFPTSVSVPECRPTEGVTAGSPVTSVASLTALEGGKTRKAQPSSPPRNPIWTEETASSTSLPKVRASCGHGDDVHLRHGQLDVEAREVVEGRGRVADADVHDLGEVGPLLLA